MARMVPPLPAPSRPSNTTMIRKAFILRPIPEAYTAPPAARTNSFSYSLRFNLELPLLSGFFVPFVVFSFRTIVRINSSKCYASSWFRDRGERFRLWFGKLNHLSLVLNQGLK